MYCIERSNSCLIIRFFAHTVSQIFFYPVPATDGHHQFNELKPGTEYLLQAKTIFEFRNGSNILQFIASSWSNQTIFTEDESIFTLE